ncbi:MAG: archease [Candidatus ainarchaeum sp.]|nr:archease [Candidatus ainarchaeum sp.]
MKSHRFLEHTADALFEASGDSFEEALEAAADALFETVADTSKIRSVKTFKIGESAGSREDLVVFTLSRLLSEMDAGEAFFKEFKVEELKAGVGAGGFSVTGEARGAPANPKIGRIVVKAVTHHLLQVREGDGGKWSIRVLLDI